MAKADEAWGLKPKSAKVVTIIDDPARDGPVVIVWKAARDIEVSIPFRNGHEIEIDGFTYYQAATSYGVALTVPAAPAVIAHPTVGPAAFWEYVAHIVAQVDESDV